MTTYAETKGEEKNLTPYEIEVLLHCYYSPSMPRETPILKETLEKFLRHELIYFDGINPPEDHYPVTGRGLKMVQMLCSTPFPEMVYIDPRFKLQSRSAAMMEGK